jgi:hypothetical protein
MHMGILLFFLYDRSPRQQLTRKLIDAGVDLFATSLRLAKLPVFRGFRRKSLALLAEAGLVPDVPALASSTDAWGSELQTHSTQDQP